MRIVLDLGTSWAWSGRPATGIARTERKFAKRLLESPGLDVAFCRFDKAVGEHVPIDRDVVTQFLEPTPQQASPTASPSPTPYTTKSTWSAQHLASGLPEPIRGDAERALRGAGDLLRGGIGLVSAPFRRPRRPRPAAPQAPPFPFNRGDLYISMGMDWAYNDLSRLDQRRCRVGFRSVLFCYDTIPVRYPHLMPEPLVPVLIDHFRSIARAADRVVAISETSRRDFLAFCEESGLTTPPVDVVHLGTDLNAPESAVCAPADVLDDRPFILCVGTIEARKNHDLLCRAWERLAARHGERTPRLVIVGWAGWGVADLLYRLRTNPALQGHVRILNDVNDGTLIWLYRHCLFTVYPSLYEGWGLPVVESLALGKPCIGSTAPAVVEASQGMALAIDPYDTPSWVGAIERLWLDEPARTEMADRLRRDYRPQSWDEHATSVLRIALKACNAPGPSVPIVPASR